MHIPQSWCWQNNRSCTDEWPLQIVIKLTFVANFSFIRYIAGGFNGSLSCFHGFFVWSGWEYTRFGRGGRKTKQNKTNNNYMLRCTILTQFDLEWKRSGEKLIQFSCFIETAKKPSGSYLVVRTHTLGRVHILSAKIDEVVRSDWCYSTPSVRLKTFLFSQYFHPN